MTGRWADFELSVDTEEVQLMLAEVNSLIDALGPTEARRRIGRPLTIGYLHSLFRIVAIDKAKMRVEPTPEFDRLIQRLWDGVPVKG